MKLPSAFSLSIATLVLVAVLTPHAEAATETWVGGSDITWSNSANWSGVDLPPISGDTLVFGVAGASGDDLNNNLTSGSFSVNGITFSSSAAPFVIGNGTSALNVGNAFVLTGSVANLSTSLETINDPFSLSGTQTFNTGFDGITLGGTIAGSGGLAQAGTGILTLLGSNSYTGSTMINSGTLQIGNGGSGEFLGSSSVNDSAALVFNHSDALTYSGIIRDSGKLTQAGSGTLTLLGNNTFSGSTIITSGVLKVGASNALSPASGVTISGGTLDARNFPQTVGALTVGSSASSLDLSLGSILSSTGAVSLGGTLNLFGVGGGTTELMSYTSHTGSFANLNLNGAASNDTLDYTPTELFLIGGTNNSVLGVSTSSVLLGRVMLNNVPTANVTVGLIGGTSATGFSISTSGGATAAASGNGPGAVTSSASGTVTVGLTNATGSYSGTVQVQNSGNDGLGDGSGSAGIGQGSAQNPISISVTGTVLSNRVVTSTPPGFVIHLGQSVSQAVTLSTSGDDNHYTRVTVSGAGPDANGLSVSGSTTFAGAGSANFTLFGTPSAAGLFTGSISLPVATAENGGAGLPGEGLYPSLPVAYSGQVFSGSAGWTGASGNSWRASGNWTDSNGSGVQAAPGTWGYNDTATFSGSGSVTAIDLTEVNPTLQALNFSTSSYTLSNGYLTLSSSSGTATVTVSGGTQSINSPVTLAASATLAVNGGALLMNSTISGSGGLTKTGSGTATLAGANTYTGATTVQGGLLVLDGANQSTSFTVASGGTLQTVGNTLTLGYQSLTAQAGGTVEYSAATINGGYLRGPGAHVVLPGGASNFNGVTTYNSTLLQQNGPANFANFTNGGQVNNNAPLNWNGGVNASSGQLIVNAACNVQDWTNNGVVTVNSGGTLDNAVSDAVFGAGSRTTINPGGQLNANSDGSGSAIDLNGGLLVNNGTVTGTTNVYYGSLAQGSGTYGSVNVFNGGQFKPGNSPGAVTTGPTTWNSGGEYLVEINDAAGTAGTNWNLWNVNGSLALDAGTTPNSVFTLVLESESGDVLGLAANFDDTRDYQWLIAQSSGGMSGFNPAEISVDAGGFANNLDGGQFGVAQEGSQVYLTFTPVPEPSTLALLAVGAIGLLSLGAAKKECHRAPRHGSLNRAWPLS